MPDRRDVLKGVGAAVAVGALWPLRSHAQSVEEVLRDPAAPVLGNPGGDLTLVEYFDYQCPYCRAGHEDVMRAVEKDGGVRLVMKDWPVFGPVSVRAAQLVLAARGTSGYEKGLHALMGTEGKLTDARVDETLRSVGLDPKALAAAYEKDAAEIDGLIRRNDLQATAFRFPGTPSFVLQTTLYPGVMEEKDLREAFAAARS